MTEQKMVPWAFCEKCGSMVEPPESTSTCQNCGHDVRGDGSIFGWFTEEDLQRMAAAWYFEIERNES